MHAHRGRMNSLFLDLGFVCRHVLFVGSLISMANVSNLVKFKYIKFILGSLWCAITCPTMSQQCWDFGGPRACWIWADSVKLRSWFSTTSCNLTVAAISWKMPWTSAATGLMAQQRSDQLQAVAFGPLAI